MNIPASDIRVHLFRNIDAAKSQSSKNGQILAFFHSREECHEDEIEGNAGGHGSCRLRRRRACRYNGR
jgi:hypothetical protein